MLARRVLVTARSRGAVLAAGIAASLLLSTRARAQIDPSAGWRTIHTPHFRIHFRPEVRAAALEEAREAERAYALLAAELPRPRGIVDVTLADDADYANGFASPIPSNRITIYLTPPATDVELQDYDHWLRVETTHELTHIFHLDQARSFWRALQGVFGRVPGLFPNAYQPTWVVEGLATYYESRLTNGGRVNGTFHTQVLASEAAAHTPRSPWNALLFTPWPDGVASYAYGSRFFRFLQDSLGDSVIPRFARATAGQLIPFRVGRQLARVAPGLALEETWGRATRPVPLRIEPAHSTLVDRGLWSEPVPRVSPDGARVAYLWDDGKGARRIRIVRTSDWRELRSHRVNAQVSYTWLGDTLVVSQLDFTSRWRVQSDLYRWRPDGRWERTTRGARLQEPRAGGGRLAAIALSGGGNHPALLGADTLADEGATWGDVVPSPDGHSIAAARNAAGHWALVRWPADFPERMEVLFATGGVVADPVWTPAGDLLFVSDPTGYPQVYRWCECGTPVALTAEPLGARAPAPLADGTLLYATFASSGWELRRAAPDSSLPPHAVPLPLPFDSAPPVPLRETDYSAWPSLRPHFWIPVWLDRGPTGRFAGAATGGTDAVGRYAYAAGLAVAGSPLLAAGLFDAVSHVLGNPSLDVSLSSDWSFVGRTGTSVLSERDQDAALGATFATTRWRMAASLRVAAEYEGTRFSVSPTAPPTTSCSGCANQDLVGGSATLGLGYGIDGHLAVSPEDGFQWFGVYRRREEQGTTRWSNELRSQVALYLRVPGVGGFAHHVLALRVSGGTLTGPLPKVFSAGGLSAGAFGVGFGQSVGETREFPVRGYAGAELSGRRAATASVEYRMPLALIGQLLGHLPFGADKLSLTLFGDAGDAWNAGVAPRVTRLRSVGAELVGDLTYNYDSPLRLRLGAAMPLTPPPSGLPQRLRGYVALSSSF